MKYFSFTLFFLCIITFSACLNSNDIIIANIDENGEVNNFSKESLLQEFQNMKLVDAKIKKLENEYFLLRTFNHINCGSFNNYFRLEVKGKTLTYGKSEDDDNREKLEEVYPGYLQGRDYFNCNSGSCSVCLETEDRDGNWYCDCTDGPDSDCEVDLGCIPTELPPIGPPNS